MGWTLPQITPMLQSLMPFSSMYTSCGHHVRALFWYPIQISAHIAGHKGYDPCLEKPKKYLAAKSCICVSGSHFWH